MFIYNYLVCYYANILGGYSSELIALSLCVIFIAKPPQVSMVALCNQKNVRKM